MKSEIKKSAAILAATVLTLSIYSCGSIKNDDKNSSHNSEKTASQVTTVSDETESKSYTESTGSDSSESVTTEDEDINVDSLVYDFKGLKSEKYINTFIGGRYKMAGLEEETGTNQEAYIDINQKKALLNISYLGKKFTVFIDDEEEYNILDKYYFKSKKQNEMLSSMTPYKNCGYVKSGEIEIKGTTYNYDEFYDLDSKSTMKLIVDKDGNLYGMEASGATRALDELTSDFDDSVFNVVEGCKEVNEDEFMKLFMGSNSSEAPAQ